MVESLSLSRQYSALRTYNSGQAIDERMGHLQWGEWETPLHEIEAAFSPLAPHHFHRHLIQRHLNGVKKSAGGVPGIAVDIMGDGKVIRELHEKGLIQGGVSLGLVDHTGWHPDEVQENERRKLYYVEGDILAGKTRRALNGQLERLNQGRRQCDLIFCRGEGGVNTLSTNPILLGMLMNYIYRLTNETGLILVQLPTDIDTNIVVKWTKKLNIIPGLEATFKPNQDPLNHGITHGLLMIKRYKTKKGDTSPESLPI